MQVDVGDFIPYIICCQTRNGVNVTQQSQSSKSNLADRAYHIQEIINSQNNHKKQQIQQTNGNDNSNDKNNDIASKNQNKNNKNNVTLLTVDKDWYLNTQILPPVARYCDPIEGTDIGQLANCLGLDSTKFVVHTNGL